MVFRLIGGGGGLVLGLLPPRFDDDQDESIEVLWTRSDVGVLL